MSSDGEEEYGSVESDSEMSEWASEHEISTLSRPKFNTRAEEKDWERKQRLREYRVASRREKRNRKADEKKQRKLNATILRRMTKNPEKYNKNADRNRLRDIHMERRNIWREAVLQAERLAAVHDPSGKMFNVGPVMTQEDGKVISVEAFERRLKAQAQKEAKAVEPADPTRPGDQSPDDPGQVNAARQHLIQNTMDIKQPASRAMSKTQQKKLAMLEERPPPPKPCIPAGVAVPDGEENWLALWDLPDEEVERRVAAGKRRKAMERKALRQKQQEGKAERRAARDERRKVYREKKLEWKAIKEAEKVQKRKLLRIEQEEAKRIEVEVNIAERRRAMEVCAALGFTLDNVEGVQDVKPKVLGMRGREIDFDSLEIGERPSDLKINGEVVAQNPKTTASNRRVDLGRATDESEINLFNPLEGATEGGEGDDFVSLGNMRDTATTEQGPQDVSLNHKLRRKLHRAMEFAQIKKELLVRAKALEHCQATGIQIPSELVAEYKPVKLVGRRVLEDGTIETEKQERVRKRLELAEYNKAAKVLRQQAKAEAIEAGLRLFAELTGQKSHSENPDMTTSSKAVGVSDTRDAPTYAKRPRPDVSEDVRQTKKVRRMSTKALDNERILETNDCSNITLDKRANDDADSSTLKSRGERQLPGNDVSVQPEGSIGRDRNSDDKLRARKSVIKNGVEGIGRKCSSESRELQGQHKGGTKAKQSPSDLEVIGTRPIDESWNASMLGGDPSRKDKFLRLLGGRKSDRSLSVANEPHTRDSHIPQLENDLAKQFDAGMRMKYDGHGQKRGLGA